MPFLHIKKQNLRMLKRAKVSRSIDVYKNTTKKHNKLSQKVSRLTSEKYLETYILIFMRQLKTFRESKKSYNY